MFNVSKSYNHAGSVDHHKWVKARVEQRTVLICNVYLGFGLHTLQLYSEKVGCEMSRYFFKQKIPRENRCKKHDNNNKSSKSHKTYKIQQFQVFGATKTTHKCPDADHFCSADLGNIFGYWGFCYSIVRCANLDEC